jgi:tetratricopeptide (TPR) repeat protein
MFKHIALIVVLIFAALAAGVAMVPGDREQWTMLWRDGQNEQAKRVLEARYKAGQRDADAVLHLHKLYMSFADIERATQVMQEFVALHPDDPGVVSLLARHYADIQNRPEEIRTLEHLFTIAPTLPTAQLLLSHYRLEGQFDREEQLLRVLLANQMITANDAERLGLMLASTGDLFGARDALIRFDEIANPERILGRLALFDVLVQIGDRTEALTKGASWLGYWRKSSMRSRGEDLPAGRLVRMMVTVDEPMTRRLICAAQHDDHEEGPDVQGTACAMIDSETSGTGAVPDESSPGMRRRRR